MGKSGKWGRFSPSWSDKKWEQTGIGKGMSNIDSYSRGKRENPREKGKIQRDLPRISSGNLGKSRWELLRALEIQPAPDSRDKAIPGGVWREKSGILVRGENSFSLKKYGEGESGKSLGNIPEKIPFLLYIPRFLRHRKLEIPGFL